MNQCEMRTAWKGHMENIYRPGILWEQRTLSHRTGIKSTEAKRYSFEMSMLRQAELNWIVYTSVCLFQLPARSRIWNMAVLWIVMLSNSPYLRLCNVLRSSHHHYQEHTHSHDTWPQSHYLQISANDKNILCRKRNVKDSINIFFDYLTNEGKGLINFCIDIINLTYIFVS